MNTKDQRKGGIVMEQVSFIVQYTSLCADKKTRPPTKMFVHKRVFVQKKIYIMTNDMAS